MIVELNGVSNFENLCKSYLLNSLTIHHASAQFSLEENLATIHFHTPVLKLGQVKGKCTVNYCIDIFFAVSIIIAGNLTKIVVPTVRSFGLENRLKYQNQSQHSEDNNYWPYS